MLWSRNSLEENLAALNQEHVGALVRNATATVSYDDNAQVRIE